MHINDLLKIATDRGASDLHLKVGSHPVLRITGDLVPLVELKRLMQEDTIAMAFSILSCLIEEGSEVNNFECVSVSNPDFLRQLESVKSQ